jgi:hypothetical protein
MSKDTHEADEDLKHDLREGAIQAESYEKGLTGHANKERWKLAKALASSPNCRGDTKAVASILYNCTAKDPCTSAACPSCQTSYQHWFTNAAAEWSWNLDHLRFVTIVPRTILPNALVNPTKYIRGQKKQLRRALKKANASTAMFFCEIELQSNIKNRSESYYQLHWHGLVSCSDIPHLKAMLKEHFPAGPMVKRPVHIQEYDGDLVVFLYMTKFLAQRKLREFENMIAVRSDALTVSERVAWSIVMHNAGFEELFFYFDSDVG